MSTTVATRMGATRTPRLTPPATPTRKPSPRRRTVGEGASLVGRADRPVLRIVSDDEGASVVTRVRPFGPVATAPRRIDLGEFFEAEYDGDDQAVAVVHSRPSSLRLTRRGRLVVFGVGLVALLGVGFVAATGSLANDRPEPTRVITVQPGQTMWDVAAGVSDGGDVRSTLAHLEALNHLDSSSLQVGQQLRVPR
jgi:LysM repeat protein